MAATTTAEPKQISELVSPVEVRVQGVSKSFPRDDGRVMALRDLDLTAPAGRFVTILGPSGSGKSTLLGILAGLDKPDNGQVLLLPTTLGDQPTTDNRPPTIADHQLKTQNHAFERSEGSKLKTHNVQVGYMPQRDLLLPWRNALDNATVALEVAGVPKDEARARVLPLFVEFGLSGFAGSYPSELSGGMRQRVSFLRSAVLARGLMLLDEPFGALDALTRASMHEWLLASSERMGSTFILVTHDIDEAILLSDMVYVLSPRPGHVVGVVNIDLPRPRRLETTNDERFAQYRKRLLELLRDTGGLATPGAAR